MRLSLLKFLGTLGLWIWFSALACGEPVYYRADAAGKFGADAADRIAAIAATLEDRPQGFGVSIDNRSFWDAVGRTENGQQIIGRAEAAARQPNPVLTDDLYLRFSKDGNRTAAQNVMFAQEDRFTLFCMAECIENKGRFIKPLEEILDLLVSYRTWVLPAHDRSLENFHQKNITIDLRSSSSAHNFALCLHMLGGRINETLAEKTKHRIHELVLAPYVRDIYDEPGAPNNFWKEATHNWNSVCHAGVTGAAVTLLEDKMDRALFIERAIFYTDNFYQGFTADGYCSEGLGYWNYGFGNYIVLSEVIYRATGGKTDVFTNLGGLAAALYPFRIEILNGQYPALADCGLGSRPSGAMMGYVNLRLGLEDSRWPLQKEYSGRKSFVEFLMFSQMDTQRPSLTPPFKPDHDQIRSFFKEAGVLICRPGKDSGRKFAAVLKGGHNAEHHNHNDLGTFIVMLEDQQIIVDPGSTEYTAKTFSKERYTIKKLASYGHPVPLVAGKEQKEGRQAEARIVRSEFTDKSDLYMLDLKSAYPVQELEKLERTFLYSREKDGSLLVKDNVEFTKPESFGTALITFGDFKQTGPATLEITEGGKTVIAEIECQGGGFKVDDELLESTKGSPRRISIQFEKPIKKGQISVRIQPK